MKIEAINYYKDHCDLAQPCPKPCNEVRNRATEIERLTPNFGAITMSRMCQRFNDKICTAFVKQ